LVGVAQWHGEIEIAIEIEVCGRKGPSAADVSYRERGWSLKRAVAVAQGNENLIETLVEKKHIKFRIVVDVDQERSDTADTADPADQRRRGERCHRR